MLPGSDRLPAIGAIGVACIAVASLYATQSFDRAGAEPAATTGPPPLAGFAADGPIVRLSNGQTAAWMVDRGSINIAAQAPTEAWIGFQAKSLRRPRTLTLQEAGGRPRSVRTTPRQAPHVVGPFELDALVSLSATVAPGPERQRPGGPALAVRLSNVRAGREPFVILPGRGFYADELENTTLFNWLGERGSLLMAGPASAREGWLRADLRSVRGARTVRVTAPGLSRVIEVPSASKGSLPVTVGPIRLTGGRASVRLTALQPPERPDAGDDRRLSIRVSAAEGLARKP